MKRWHQRLAWREQLLLLGFLGLAALIWSWGASSRAARLLDQWRGYRADRAEQDLWLDRREQIFATSAEAARHLRPELTLDAIRLFSEVNRLAQDLGCEVGGQTTEQSGSIAIHSVQLTLRKVGLADLLRLYQALQQRSPYVGIEQCEVAADRTEPGRLNASLRIYAIQILSPAAVRT